MGKGFREVVLKVGGGKYNFKMHCSKESNINGNHSL